MAGSILFVDDEPNILKSLCRTFLETGYDLAVAESGGEALGKMKEAAFDLVVSDMRMPNMDGFQFLSRVKELYPSTFRIILSGYTDEKMILKALQQNVAMLYTFKPWDNDSLVKLVNHIFETREILGSSKLLTMINNSGELPTIQSSYKEIISLIEKDCDMAYIAREIEKDQSMASKILHMANSAYYGAKTGSIKQAVTYLGLQNVKNLVLSTSVFDTLAAGIKMNSKIKVFWDHSFTTNKILHFIYEACLKRKLEDVSRTAGLLHNIGIVFLLKCYGNDYLRLMDRIAADKGDSLAAERSAYSFTHQEAGGYLLNWWELPYSIVEAALYHHFPLKPEIVNRELVCAVHIAGRYSFDMVSKPKYFWQFHEEAFQVLGLDKGKFEEQLARSDIFKG